jgi:hypothetical protein
MIRHLVMIPLVVALAGCSIAMSANRQSYRGDPAIIQVGADRDAIESALGPPDILTGLDNGRNKAIYKIDPNAVRSSTKTVEMAGNVVFDVLSFGLWEVVATPIELGSQDKITNYIITYSADRKVETVDTFK